MPYIVLLLLLTFTLTAQANSARIAVASNFAPAIKKLAAVYQANSGHQIQLAFGSTGKHYAQIYHGAPFDAFFAADIRRAHLLEKEGKAIPGSRFTYAIGQLALWSSDPAMIKNDSVLDSAAFQHLAMANPKLAPYGRAAEEFLQTSGRKTALRSRLIFGENISQTYQFVATGNAELGFVAWSQLKRPGHEIIGSWWLIPKNTYTPIEQQALLLNDNPAARGFLKFVQSIQGRAIIQSFGYLLPDVGSPSDEVVRLKSYLQSNLQSNLVSTEYSCRFDFNRTCTRSRSYTIQTKESKRAQ